MADQIRQSRQLAGASLHWDDRQGRFAQLQWFWDADRFAHRVILGTRRRRAILLTSSEGDEQQRWPPSPPLQHLSPATIANREVVLGIGMSGSTHWSASFQLRDDRTVIAELAARLSEPAPGIGSTYKIAAGANCVHDGGSGVGLHLPEGRLYVQPLEATRLQRVDRLLRIGPQEEQSCDHALWSFVISWQGSH